MNLEFSNKLLDWYWEHGFQRADKYSLPASSWVRELYEVRDELTRTTASSQDIKPAFAVWGPSQTGKSMLVSAYFDRFSIRKRETGEDGKNSALYWPGGLPCFFVMPDEFKNDPPSWINVLNPFRLGKDASACLSRFTLGSLTPMPGRHHVHTPIYPIQLKLLNQTELLHVLARGYDTECLGPSVGYGGTTWNVDEFRDRTEAVKRKFAAKPGPVSKEAVEMLLSLCSVLKSIVFAELPRYKELMKDGEVNWENILAGLLDDPQLNSNSELVEMVAAEILWDGAAPLTEAFRNLKNEMAKFDKMWGKRTLYCDLQVAALFLDMDSVLVAFDGAPPGAGEKSRDRQIQQQIEKLRYKIDGDKVFIGLSPSLTNPLSVARDSYGHLQSLILELVIPVNPDFVEDSNFKKFLEKSDLLDFPGVGNENNPKFTRIDLGFPNSPAASGAPSDVPPENRYPKYSPQRLFTRILKRGKTATIVSLYAKRLKIDGFSIFVALDKNPPAKPSELNEGIETWWKCAVPDYFKSGCNKKSPLPLNLVILWWAGLINEVSSTTGNYMSRIKWIYDPLGDISNPQVANFFAMNYYGLPRGLVQDPDKLKPNSSFVTAIMNEQEFRRVFGGDESPSLRSFMTMLEDEKTGGAEFYFNELCRQLESPVLRRDQILKDIVESAKKKSGALLSVKDLFPEPEERDIRRETLEEMKMEISQVLKDCDERDVAQINHLLREMLNIDFRTLKPVPMFTHEVSATFVRSQYASWITSQCNRVDTWRKNGRKEKPDWTLLGLDSREKLRSWLEALVASIEPHLLPMSVWLKDLVEYNSGRQATDLRRVLAIQMGNVLVYGKSGPPAYDMGMSSSATFDTPLTDNKGNVLKGGQCSSYKVFLQPFLEQQLERLLNEGVEMIQRQEQPGDGELRELCVKFNCLPAAAVPA
jgi:hypothetical protein